MITNGNIYTNQKSQLNILKGENINLEEYRKKIYDRINNTCSIIQKYDGLTYYLNIINKEYKENINYYLFKYGITQISFNNLIEIYRYIPFWIFYQYKIICIRIKRQEKGPKNFDPNSTIKVDLLLNSTYQLIKNSNYKKYSHLEKFTKILLDSLHPYAHYECLFEVNNRFTFQGAFLTKKEKDNFKEIIQLGIIRELDFVRCTISSNSFFSLVKHKTYLEQFDFGTQQTLILCKDNYFFTNIDWKGYSFDKHENFNSDSMQLEYLLTIITKKNLATNFTTIKNKDLKEKDIIQKTNEIIGENLNNQGKLIMIISYLNKANYNTN